MQGMWYIDGVDVFTAYGLVIEKGSADLLRIAPRKESIVHDWRESHGKEYDTDYFFFDERQTTLNVGILADTADQFWTNYDNLVAHLSKPGVRRLELKAHPGRQYFFIYKECGSIAQVQPLTGDPNSPVGQKFTLTIVEPNPSPATGTVQAIVDDQGRFITT
jgi:hypothetical protein